MTVAHVPPVVAIELVAERDEAGLRLDVLLCRRLPVLSRARVRSMLDAGEIHVNGRRCRKGARITPGDRVTLDREPDPGEFAALPDRALPLVIAYEDDHLVVLDKAPGVPSHPLKPTEIGTVASALVARYPEMAGVGWRPREPGILHRLDAGTSGLMLAARDEPTFDALLLALREGRIEKRYVALVHGVAEVGIIDAPIAPHPSDPRRVKVGPGLRGERPTRTEILAVKERWPDRSEVEVRAGAAARHQVRAHLSHLGHPLVGDTLYGAPAEPTLRRHLLHASYIGLVHPKTGARLAWSSRPPF